MKIDIISIGKHMPSWVADGVAEYQKRMPRELTVRLIEISEGKRSHGMHLKNLQQKESDAMLTAIPKHTHVIALTPDGKSCSSETLAQTLGELKQLGKNMCFLIGGPEGLSEATLQRADCRISLSAMTFPHMLVRVILMEQLYRAWSIDAQHPYHR